MKTKDYVTTDFCRYQSWVAEQGGDIFPTKGALEWFVRQHRKELIESGELIIRRGAGGTLVGPGFGRLAVQILQRETKQIDEAC